jgi:hypothetical protein
MDEATFRQRVTAYLAHLDGQDLPACVFRWSARLLTPFVDDEGTITREVCATVAARTWVEAAAKIALYDLKQKPERWVTDVLLGKDTVIERAWDRKGRFFVLDNPFLIRRDLEEEEARVPILPFPATEAGPCVS